MAIAYAHESTADQRRANRKLAVEGRTVICRVRRCDGPGKGSRWESFRVSVEPGMNVIACLKFIAQNPVTSGGATTTPVVYDAGCLEEVCGACTMLINGHARQSCSCLIDEYAPREGDTITLEPMTKFPVIRDLWVDRARLFHSLSRIKAWVPIDGTYSLGGGPKESPEIQQDRYDMSECMSCGCCLEACPQFTIEPDEAKWETAFIGAHAISQARLFNGHSTGKQLKNDRLDELMTTGGISDCGNAQNCVKVCPKGVPLTESIATIGRQVTLRSFTRFFSGK